MPIFVKKNSFTGMATDTSQISYPQSGMVRDLHPAQLNDSQYTFAMNANIESEDGNVNMRSNEHSNMRCIGFGDYKVLGYKNDLTSGFTYFFITNPKDKTSKIVYFKPCDDITTLTDEQIEAAVQGNLGICSGMQVLIEDNADDPCLNFSLYHPIKTIEIKTEKCGKCIYWTDDYNPPRYVIVERALEPDDDGDIFYHYHGYKICSADYDRDEFMKENSCVLACEKLRVFPLLEQPCVEPVQIEYGGSLRGGVYQFTVALCDEFGNEKSNYSELTNPISIFDQQYIRVTDGHWGERTNLGIRVKVSNLDRQVSHYKLAVVQNTVGYNGETQPVLDYFIEGVHPITETTILYYSDLNNTRTTFEHLAYRRAVYNTSRGIVSVGNRLLQYGLTAEKEWNLQPVVSLMGHFLKWHCGVAHEDLYKDGNACSLYTGYMRNEVYPFAISFKTSTGYKTPAFVLVPPPSEIANTKVEDMENNIPYQSINQYAPPCSGIAREYKWQYENTAGNVEDLEIDGESGVIERECQNPAMVGKTAVYENIFYNLVNQNVGSEFEHTNNGISVVIETDQVVGSVIQYFADHIEELACGSPYEDSYGNKDEGARIVCDIITKYNDCIRDSASGQPEYDDDKLSEIDGIETPNPEELGTNCETPHRQTSEISCPVQLIESFKEDYVYKTLDQMAHVTTDYLYSAGGQSQNKYSILFDYEIADEVEEYVEKQLFSDDAGLYTGDGSNQRLKSELQPYFQYGNLLKAISDSMYILDVLPCTCGCNENDICDNPSINQEDYNAFQTQPTFIASHILEYDIWNREGDNKGLYDVDRGSGSNVYSCYNWDGLDDYRAGRSTSTVVNDAYNSHVAPQQIIDIWWNNSDPEKNVKNRILNDYSLEHLDLGEDASYPDVPDNMDCNTDEGRWIWEVYTNLSDDMLLLPADTKGQPQLAATSIAYRFMRYVNRSARFIRIDRPSEWDEPDYPERNKVMYLEAIGKTEGTRDAMSPEVVRIAFWEEIDERYVKQVNRGPSFDFNENGVLKKDANNRYYIVKIDRPGFAQIDESFFSQFASDHKYFYVTIDCPVVFSPWLITTRQIQFVEVKEDGTEEDGKKPSKGMCGGTFALGKTTFPYIFGIREKEIDKINVYAKNLSLRSTVVFASQCETCGDKPLNCAPRPFKQGDFAYWQSSELYPANFELWDSKRMKIDTSRTYEDSALQEAKSEIISKLTEYYGAPVSDGGTLEHFEGTTLGEGDSAVETSTTFCQQPIRHYKFPDNHVMPFMNSDTRVYDTPSEIYPIGVLLNEDIVQVFLDFAVDSGLITQEQRDTVVGYELFRGDRRLNRSVVATGVAYDMFKWIGDDGKINIYPNYPYNDLSDDYYLYKRNDRLTTINHPFYKEGNVWYSFLSPDNYFNKPELPTEVSIEGFQQGMAVGTFVEVEEHPKWTILGSRAYRMANQLANIESIATVAAIIAEELQVRAQSAYVGVVGNLSVAMLFSSMITTISQTLSKRPVLYGKYRYDWLNTFMNNGPRRNYAFYYTSIGYYNSMTSYINEEDYENNKLRGLSTVKEIKSGTYPVSDDSALSNLVNKSGNDDYKVNNEGNLIYVNNIFREGSVFFSFGNPGESSETEEGITTSGYKYLVTYPTHIKNYDDSRVVDSVVMQTDPIAGEKPVQQKYLSSLTVPYMKAMRYVPDQYGGIENISWVSVGDCGMFKGGLKMLYGGDVYISRFSLKRKYPFFFNNAFHIGDMIPFPYDDYRNVGFPRYFVDYDTGDDMLEITDNERFNTWTSSQKGTYSFFPNRYSVYELNGFREDDKYVKGRFYLWMYGIPQFLVESEVNCNFRLEGTQPNEWFYPAVGDYVWWTQEKNVSIERDNEYRISPIYFSRTTFTPNMLPATYERKFYDCAYQRPNGVIWSREDVSENSQTDPWLTYKPMDYHEFPTKNGKLIHMKRIESEQLLVRFEDQVSLHNAIDVIRERTTGSTELGTGGLFATRPLEYNTTDLGYSGTQSTEIISCEFGHFWVDVKRAQVFQTDPNGRNLKEVSVGIQHWLKRHLPFKILRYGIINTNTEREMEYGDADNKFTGLGLSLGWDNEYKRVFITKLDYIPTQDPSSYKFTEGRFYVGGTEVSVKDPAYFKDVSFTIAYSCTKQEWISYYSFKPDYYIEQHHYFMTALNFSSDESEVGVWSHLLTNKSYETFYGKTYPFELEVPLKEKYVGSILSSVEYELDARKYVDNVNYTLDRKVGLDSIIIYNDTNNSGELVLIPEEKNNLQQKLLYPRVVDGRTEVLDTEVYRRHKLNDFFNRVNDDRSEDPVWSKDENDIEKTLNVGVLNYRQNWLDRLRGSWMLMRLKKTISDRKVIFHWVIGEDKRKNR